MHDGDELRSEPGLYITSYVLDSGGDGIMSCEGRVYDDTEPLHLQVGLVQGFKKTAVVEVMIEWDGEVWISDCGG